MEGDNSSGSILHKILASPRFVRRESQQQAGETAVLKSFRTLPEEESYPHPTNHGDINSSYISLVHPSLEIKNDVRSEQTVKLLSTEDNKGGDLQSPLFPSWRRPFSSSITVLADSDVVKVTRVETYSDNENEDEDGDRILPGEPKVTEKSLDQDKESIKYNLNQHRHEMERDMLKTDSTLTVLTDRKVLDLAYGISVLNRTWSNEHSDRHQDSVLDTVDQFHREIASKGILRDSYLIHNNGVETNVDTGLDVPHAKDSILRQHDHSFVPGDCSNDEKTGSPIMSVDSLHVASYMSEHPLEGSTYTTKDSLHVPSACVSPLKLATDFQPIPASEGNAPGSSLVSEKPISYQEESLGTPTQKTSFASSESQSPVTVASSTSGQGSNITKDPLEMDQKEFLNDSVSSATSPSQDIKEDLTAIKKTTSNPPSNLSPKPLSSTSREPYQLPALFSGLRVLKKGAVGEDRETLSEIKQKDSDRAMLNLRQHVNKAKLQQHQASTSTPKKGTEPKDASEAKSKWRQMLHFDDIRNDESLEKKPKDIEGLNTGEKVVAKDPAGDSFKFLSSFKSLMKDTADVSADLEAAKKKRKNDRELLKSIFEKTPSKATSIDKSPEEVKVCITHKAFTRINDKTKEVHA